MPQMWALVLSFVKKVNHLHILVKHGVAHEEIILLMTRSSMLLFEL